MKKLTSTAFIIAAAVLIAAAAFSWFFISGDSDEDREGNGGDTGQEREVESHEKNFLILGLDTRGGDTGRTDTIMVVNADPAGEQVTLLSIPRDTRVDLKGSYEKVNAAYVYGGTDLVIEAVEDLLDIEIDHYVIANFEAFVEVVDLFGGVKVDVPTRMYYSAEDIDLQPGEQVLDGKDALAFARYRFTEGGDIDRAANQQKVLKALWDKALRVENIPKIPEFVRLISEYVETDIPNSEMLKMGTRAKHYQDQELVTMTLPGEVEKIEGIWYYIHDEEEIEEIISPFKKD